MEALGPILIVIAIPLLLRWIPPNRFYGLRISATLKNESVWYDANALSGRHFLILGLVMVGSEIVLPALWRVPVLWTMGTVGLLAVVIADCRTAIRWARERTSKR